MHKWVVLSLAGHESNKYKNEDEIGHHENNLHVFYVHDDTICHQGQENNQFQLMHRSSHISTFGYCFGLKILFTFSVIVLI